MSMATNASTAGRRRHNPARVSGSADVRCRRTATISRSGITQRRTMSPARDRRPDDGGTATSTGLVGSRSRPNSQAAVAPTKMVSGGSTRRHAESVSQGSSGSSFQRYNSAPRRCQLLPLSALRVRPALRASSRKKGLRVSSGGMRGVLPTAARWGFRSISPTHLVKAVEISGSVGARTPRRSCAGPGCGVHTTGRPGAAADRLAAIARSLGGTRCRPLVPASSGALRCRARPGLAPRA